MELCQILWLPLHLIQEVFEIEKPGPRFFWEGIIEGMVISVVEVTFGQFTNLTFELFRIIKKSQ